MLAAAVERLAWTPVAGALAVLLWRARREVPGVQGPASARAARR